MDNEKRTPWWSWVSLGLSVVSISICIYTINCEPIVAKEINFEWLIGLLIAAIGIAVTALIGVQINAILSVDKKISKGN